MVASSYVKSPLNYMGGKFKILSTIMPKIKSQPTDVFVDVFAGGFNVGVNSNAETVVCNDQIVYLVNMLEYLSNTPTKKIIEATNACISEFNLSKENAEGYLRLRERYNAKKTPLDLFVLTCFSFNHQIRFNSKHQFNVPFGKNRSSYNTRIENNLQLFCQVISQKKVIFSSKDFRELSFDNLTKNSLVYCDPPYLISTGTYNDGRRGFSGWGKQDERDLLDLLTSLNDKKIRFALSNAFTNKGLVNELLIDWARDYKVLHINNSFTNCSYHYLDRNSGTDEVMVTNF